MELIPAIDLRHGRAVRLRQGDDAQATVYGDDPVAVLESYARAGVARVHVVDLDAALGEAPQRELIERMLAVGAKVQLGGGLRDREAIDWALGAGCDRVVIGSMVARDVDGFRALAEERPGWLVPALDVANGEVRIAGWREGATARSRGPLRPSHGRALPGDPGDRRRARRHDDRSEPRAGPAGGAHLRAAGAPLRRGPRPLRPGGGAAAPRDRGRDRGAGALRGCVHAGRGAGRMHEDSS